MSFVRGKENVSFLKRRFEALVRHPGYAGMEYTEDGEQIAKWTPLVMAGRSSKEILAATRIERGTDVDYGHLTREFFAYLEKLEGVEIHYGSHVKEISRSNKGNWKLSTDKGETREAPFVFLGAGGGTLPLLQKAKIPEIRGYAGFPVSGVWLRCDKPSIARAHFAKVYGKASAGSPPMSVPHLDTRIIQGKRSLLFGPYAGFSPKFLKKGSSLIS